MLFRSFTPTPEAFGQLYQWNSKVAIAHEERAKIKYITETVWEAANNPCPDGWRIPTLEEAKALLNTSSQYIQKNGINGKEFKDKTTGNAIFIPKAGYWNYNDKIGFENEDGDYWTSYIDIYYSIYQAHHICLKENTIIDIPIPRAASVRCVRERLPDGECMERDTFVTICEKELPYDFCDTTFLRGTESGIYTFHRFQFVTGCDSIVHLHLTVGEIPPLEFSGEVCQGENYTGHDFFVPSATKDTIVRQELKTHHGCDSIRILYLTVHPVYNMIVYDTVCQGEPYHGYGFSLTNTETSTEGTITRDSIYESIHGCDSLVTLNLFVGKSYIFKTEREICQGDTVMWRGKSYAKEGTYEEPFTTMHGCDSVYRLLLTVHPVYDTVFFGKVCQGESYTEYGFNLPKVMKDTIVRDTLQTRWLCDSVRTLYLTVHPVHDTIVYDTICEGDRKSVV